MDSINVNDIVLLVSTI